VPYLSEMLGMRIETTQGVNLGRLEDVIAASGAKFPPVKGIVSRKGYGKKAQRFYIPWREVLRWDTKRFVVSKAVQEEILPESNILLARDILDKQIVDMEGYKIVRVSDIRIARAGGELRVMSVDVGLVAILRRLGFVKTAEKLRSGTRKVWGDRVIPWNLVSPVEAASYNVQLQVPYREFLELHPSDIADIIEQLDVEQRAKIMSLVEDPKAAEVLKHILPNVRSSVAEAMGDERLSDLLEIMPPDEAADILASLPREKAQTLLRLMGIEEASAVRELLGYDPETAGGKMTVEFVSIPQTMTVGEVINYLREVGRDAETIYYVYVVDSEGHLSGVVSLRDLLRASPRIRVSETMERDVKTVELDDDQQHVAEVLSKYNLLAVPVVDEDHVLKGIVTVDDVIDVMRGETAEDISQLSGLPFEMEGSPARGIGNSRRWIATLTTFLGGILATALLGIFKYEFVATIAVAYFIPILVRSTQDISLWSLAVTVSDIGKTEERRRILRLLFREYSYTIVIAAMMGIFCFSLGLIWTRSKVPALAGGMGIFAGVSISGILAFAMPFFKDSKRDPAGSSRLFGVLTMIVSLISFLVVCSFVIGWR